MKKIFFTYLFLLLVSIAPVFASKVVDFGPECHYQACLDCPAEPMKKYLLLKDELVIDTPKGSFAEVIFSGSFDNVFRLDTHGQLRVVKKDPLSLDLLRGRLFVLRDWESDFVFRVKTPEVLVQVNAQAGAMIWNQNEKTIVAAYADGVTCYDARNPQKSIALPEGHKLIFKRSGPANVMVRMDYEDYKPWLFWSKKWYEKKDDFIYDIVEKEFNL